MKTYIWIILLTFFLPAFLLAWNSTGHKIVAAIAYDQMSTETQNTVRDILRNHPEYDNWMEEIPEKFNEGAYLMMRSSLWPDEIRRTDNPFDHPEWHYVNFFIHRETASLDTTRQEPDNDILYGIDKSIDHIESDDELTRAAYLAWLNHLVGDIHQPLHCGSVTSEEYPEGDRGGNYHWVMDNGKPIKLHFYWDMLPGRISDYNDYKNAVVRLTDHFPDTDFSLTELSDHYEWALESLQITYETAHLKLQLPVAYSPAEAQSLSEDYHMMAEEIYKKRIMLAGYRLKLLLEHILKEK